jgi:hypothetical protein
VSDEDKRIEFDEEIVEDLEIRAGASPQGRGVVRTRGVLALAARGPAGPLRRMLPRPGDRHRDGTREEETGRRFRQVDDGPATR